jgi:predicted TIM-barrel enzyme
MDAVLERAIADLEALEAGGVGGITLETMGHAPFFKTEAPAETVAAFAAVAVELKGATALPCAAPRQDA